MNIPHCPKSEDITSLAEVRVYRFNLYCRQWVMDFEKSMLMTAVGSEPIRTRTRTQTYTFYKPLFLFVMFIKFPCDDTFIILSKLNNDVLSLCYNHHVFQILTYVTQSKKALQHGTHPNSKSVLTGWSRKKRCFPCAVSNSGLVVKFTILSTSHCFIDI